MARSKPGPAGVPARRLEFMPLSTIAPAPRNPKAHHGDAIKASIERFGLADLPVLDERTGRLVSGHGRLEQAQAMHAAGQAPPDGIDIDPASGEWRMPVVRGWRSPSDIEAAAYLVAANHTTTLGGWDDDALGQLLTELNDADPDLFAVTGFTDEDLAALLDGAEDDDPGGGGGGDDGAGPEVPDQPVTVYGDLWHLGPHRLLCGDATNPDDLTRVLDGLDVPGIVYTDPPYGISIVKKTGNVGGYGPGVVPGPNNHGLGGRWGTYLPVAGDNDGRTAADAFGLLLASYPAAFHVWWGGNHYASSAGLPDGSCWLVWDKDTNGDFADAELAWTNHPGAVRLFRHMWNGMLRASERGKRVHPTQKPVKLARWAFGVVDPKEQATVVLDVFGGSGSTLIAAHETGRTAAVIEMEPAYVDVIARRFQLVSGVLPVLASTGQPHDFTAGQVDEG